MSRQVKASPQTPTVGAARYASSKVRYLAMLGSFCMATALLVSLQYEIHNLNQHLRDNVELMKLERRRANEEHVIMIRTLLAEEAKKLEETAKEMSSEVKGLGRNLSDVSFVLNSTVLQTKRTCTYGVAGVIPHRSFPNGTSVEYWREVYDRIPFHLRVVAVLNRSNNNTLVHPRITHVLQPMSGDPPDFDSNVIMRPLKRNFNDTLERVRWRSKIVLDFVRMVRFVSDRCRYVIWLEDDVTLPLGWFANVVNVTPAEPTPWLMVWLSKGMPAVLFNTQHIDFLLQYLIHHFDDQPVDWLINYTADELNKINKGFLFPAPQYPLIGHRGVVSSLPGAELRPQF
jgi:hypothetical protein